MPIKTDDNLVAAARMLFTAQRVVCLTGAGVSAESGIATFRDAQTGLWAHFDPLELASQQGFAADPGLVWQWYMQRLARVEAALPNAGHTALAHLESRKPFFTLITQNVDDLHERAGNRHILHLHGRIDRFHCNVCLFQHELRAEERLTTFPPHCSGCNGLIRPSVVWFGESLPGRVLDRASLESERCNVCMVVGTSGAVFPAAQLPYVAHQKGALVIEVNPDFTPISEIADIHLRGASGELLPRLIELMAALSATH
jgi:NAD-dependent deacetylase